MSFLMKASTHTTRSSNGGEAVVLWGALYGALWSLAPGILSELLRRPGEAATVVFAGIVTGMLVSATLVPFIRRAKRGTVIVLGVLSLPLGAWIFGIVVSWCQWVVLRLTGTHYRFVMQIVEAPGSVFDPWRVACDYARGSTLTPLALLFIPLAVLTTLHLRARLLNSSLPPQP